MNIHDVHTVEPQPMPLAAHLRGIDPELLKRQARGMTAAGAAKDILGGAELANALRMQQMEMPGVAGHGYAAQGPTLLQGLAVMAGNRQGGNKVRELEAQARALRGETQDGALAQMQMQDQAAQLERQGKYEASEADRAWRSGESELDRAGALTQAKLMSEERQEMERLRQSAMRGGLKTWVNPVTGETLNASYAPGVGAVDERNQPVSIEGYIPYEESTFAKKHGTEFRDIPNAMKMQVVEADKGMRQLNRISEIANTFDKKDIEQLNRAALDLGVKIASPKAVEEYLKSNKMGYSEKVRDYLIRVNDFASVLRHERFGSALTGNEIAFSEAFLPSATGIDLQERTQRLNKYYENLTDAVRPIDSHFGSSFESRLPGRVEFVVPEWAKQRKSDTVSRIAQKVTPAMQSAWKEMEAENERYRAIMKTDMPEYTQMKEMMGFGSPADKRSSAPPDSGMRGR